MFKLADVGGCVQACLSSLLLACGNMLPTRGRLDQLVFQRLAVGFPSLAEMAIREIPERALRRYGEKRQHPHKREREAQFDFRENSSPSLHRVLRSGCTIRRLP